MPVPADGPPSHPQPPVLNASPDPRYTHPERGHPGVQLTTGLQPHLAGS